MALSMNSHFVRANPVISGILGRLRAVGYFQAATPYRTTVLQLRLHGLSQMDLSTLQGFTVPTEAGSKVVIDDLATADTGSVEFTHNFVLED